MQTEGVRHIDRDRQKEGDMQTYRRRDIQTEGVRHTDRE